MIISIDAETALEGIQPIPIPEKSFRKQRIEKTFLNLLMGIYKNPIANAKLNGKRLNTFPLRSGTNQERSLS